MATSRLTNPVILLSLVLLIVNDHILKGTVFSGFLTGKLSDFAGLFFFPFFIAECLRTRSLQCFAGIAALTAIVFYWLKTSPVFLEIFMEAYEALGLRAAVVQDHSDLWALLVLPLAVVFERSLLLGNPQPGDSYETES